MESLILVCRSRDHKFSDRKRPGRVGERKENAVATTPLHYQSLMEVSRRIHQGEISSREVTGALLERIDGLDSRLHAFSVLTADQAISAAAAADAEIAAGDVKGPLHGVPIAVKDLCRTRGVRTRAGMPLLNDYIPDYDATAVARLRSAGAVILGKLQLTEGAFAFHHPDIVSPLNPWGAGHWAGASSSGSGAATAAGLCYGSLGSDTGGSIRYPCLACGLTGLKPTWGLVSRHGVFMLSDTLDHLGPMTRTAEDAAAILAVIAGSDEDDHHTALAPVPDYLAELAQGAEGLRIGWDESYCTDGVDPEVAAALGAALAVLKRAGAEVVEVTVPDTHDIIAHWAVLCAAETAVAHEATYPSRAGEYGPDLRAFIDSGIAATSLDVGRANICRNHWRGTLARVLRRVDMLMAPPYFGPTPSLEAFRSLVDEEDGLFKLTRYAAPYDMSGSPTLSLPCGFDAAGLPLGFQLIGRDFTEALLLRAGHAYQHHTDWHRKHPSP